MRKLVRGLFALVGYVATATVLTTVAGWMLLRSSGRLDDRALADIRRVLAGERIPEAAEVEAAARLPSFEQILEERARRFRELERREDEIAALRQQLLDERQDLLSERQTWQQQREAFEQQLAALRETATSEGMETQRTILAQLPAAAAKDHLMTMDVDEAVLVLSEMAERTVSRILREFESEEEVARRTEILNALGRGEPEASLADAAVGSP